MVPQALSRLKLPRRLQLVASFGATGFVIAVGGLSPGSSHAESTPDGLAVDEFSSAEVAELLSDDSFEVRNGGIVVSEPAILGPFADAIDEKPGPDNAPAQVTVAEAFSLHSQPNASRRIFLDFDGHTTTGTNWNQSQSVITSGPYSNEPSGSRDANFSTSELDNIVDIWRRVAEDYAAWDVDVTTADPGVGALTKSSSTDTSFGIRVVISQDSAWYGPYGGAAYLSSFGRSSELPAFVFSSNLANGNPKSVAESASHEVGHTLGLRHDGIFNSDGSVNGYYSGHDAWAPIMGVGYRRTVTQWSKGEYAGANNTEDDLAIIDQTLPRQFDWTSTTPLGGSDSVDTFSIVDGGATNGHALAIDQGPATVVVRKASADGNLHASVTIRNESSDVVATMTPTAAADWSLTRELSAGSYTIEVRSVGWLTPNTGFTSYASIGDYTIGVDVPATTTTTTTPPTTTPSTTTTTNPSTPTTDPTQPTASAEGDRVTPITPRRLLDTRKAQSSITRLSAGRQVRVPVTGLPDDASAVIVNVTAVKPSTGGWLSITPCNPVALDDRTSSLNFTAGKNVANSVIAPVSSDGAICLYSSTATDVIVDVTGWTEPDGTTALGNIGSRRLVDTREGLGISRRLGAGERTIVSLSRFMESADTEAVAINVTAVNPSSAGFLTVNDCSLQGNQTSSVNFAARETRGNNGIVPLSASDALCITASVSTHVTIDITGEFVAGDGLTFVPAEPTRILDTRSSQRLAAGASTGFTVPVISSEDGLSMVASAASINLASLSHPTGGHITAWDCSARPTTSALNPVIGAPTANGALVEVTSTSRSCLYHSSGGNLIVDLNGWWV